MRLTVWITAITVGLVVVAAGCSDDDTAASQQAGDPATALPDETSTTTSTTDAAPTATSAPEPTAPSSGGESEAAPIDVDALTIQTYPVPAGSRPHDVAPAADGGIWYTAQNLGRLGWLDPETGETFHVELGAGSRPHGVIVDGDGTAWITDGGLNAIVAVDPATLEPTVFALPADRADANLNTAAFDGDGALWFTGQSGIYGSFDPATEEMVVYDAPRGRGPYGVAATPTGSIFIASLAGSYVGAVQPDGSLEVLEPPTAEQGARRVWSDSAGSIWVSEWNSGNLSRYVPSTGAWTTWALPGDASTYAVYVDEMDIVWTSDFTANALVRFDPSGETFTQLPLPHPSGDVRQILGRPGEVWGAESAADHLVVIRTVE